MGGVVELRVMGRGGLRRNDRQKLLNVHETHGCIAACLAFYTTDERANLLRGAEAVTSSGERASPREGGTRTENECSGRYPGGR